MLSLGSKQSLVALTILTISSPTLGFMSQAGPAVPVTRPVLQATASEDQAENQVPDDPRRHMEFKDLEPLPENKAREERISAEVANRDRFVAFGDDLWDLRASMDRWSRKLVHSLAEGATQKEDMARESLREAEQKDPELVYMLELAEVEDAIKEGRLNDVEKHQELAIAARSCLPQFNLEGLWVGKYGSNGYEMINVTYYGDLLVATKVTGDKNVPRGKVTFQADLNPLHRTKREHEKLQPIMLTDKASRKWGTRQLPRYAGKGQVAEENFENNQWLEGQLIIIGDSYFSFAWVPVETQIFFGRPSPELALKMLKAGGVLPLRASQIFDEPPSIEDDVQVQKDFVARCFEVTDEHHEDVGDDFTCIWTGSETEECYFE